VAPSDSAADTAVPLVDVSALFQAPSDECKATDAAILQAAVDIGFLSIVGLPANVPIGRAARARLLRIFDLDKSVLRALWRRKFAPENPNVYRGWFPVQPGNLTSKEGMDIGADIAFGASLVIPDDPLRERTPLPAEGALPGWRSAIEEYYRAVNGVCATLMQSIARSLGLEEHYFDDAFHYGLSTLRLLRYPVRLPEKLVAFEDPEVWVSRGAERHPLIGAAHTDSGFITLLAQDEVPGLQARTRTGSWVDVAPHEHSLVVNFGQVLERWSGRRIKATEHRVVGMGEERYSIPFFFEARADAEISPLPMDDPESFDSVLFGDYRWARVTNFVEFRGMEALRAPLRGTKPHPRAS